MQVFYYLSRQSIQLFHFNYHFTAINFQKYLIILAIYLFDCQMPPVNLMFQF